jgi:hypothetical protein
MNFDRGAGAFKCSGRAVDFIFYYRVLRDPHDLELSRMPGRMRPRVKRFLTNLVVRLPELRRDPNQT